MKHPAAAAKTTKAVRLETVKGTQPQARLLPLLVMLSIVYMELRIVSGKCDFCVIRATLTRLVFFVQDSEVCLEQRVDDSPCTRPRQVWKARFAAINHMKNTVSILLVSCAWIKA